MRTPGLFTSQRPEGSLKWLTAISWEVPLMGSWFLKTCVRPN